MPLRLATAAGDEAERAFSASLSPRAARDLREALRTIVVRDERSTG